MATLRLLCVCLCLCFFVNSEPQTEDGSNSSEAFSSEIAAVLNCLNSTPFKVYNYKEATLLNAHKKADITELALEVNVDCINNYPDVPCREKFLICNAFVRNTPEQGSQVLNDVNCKPKPEIIIEEPAYEPTVVNGENESNETKSIALSNEAVSSEVGEPFVAVKKNLMPCLGCPFDLNPNAEGVDELIDVALEHIGTERSNKQALVKVLKLQQQVVSGVKYFLVAEIAPTICAKDSNLRSETCPRDNGADTSVCLITYLQKPWISKTKHVIGNNCTVSQEYVKSDAKRSDISNEIDTDDNRNNVPNNTPNFDQIAETGAIDSMAPSRLADLESQILLESTDGNQQKSWPSDKVVDEIVVPSTTGAMPASRLSDLESQISEDEIVVPSTAESQTQVESEIDSSENMSTSQQQVPSTEARNEEELELRSKRDDGDQENQKFPQRFKGSSEEINNPPAEEENSPEEDTEKDRVRRSDESNSSESAESNSNATASNLRQANNSSESVESGESKSNVTLSNFEQGKNSSEEVSSEEKTRPKRAVPQLEKISPEEKGLVKNLADFAAAALDGIDDDNHRRIILQILGAKKMVGDDGVYYHLIMRMGISRCLEDKPVNPYENCRDKLFENYTKICKVQVYVNDDFGTPKVVKSQCQNIKRDKNDSNRTNYSRFRRQVLGEQTQEDSNNEDIKLLVRQGVTHLNARSNKTNKYKPIEIVSATTQVVEGIMYRIKTKVSQSDCSKNDRRELDDCNVAQGASPQICEIQVWEKLWENFREFTVKCEVDEPAFSVETKVRDKRRNNKHDKNDYPSRFGREIRRGGQTQADSNNEKIKLLARQGVTHLNAQSNKNNKYKPIEVVSATTQVVAGIMYRIKTKVSESDCSKNDPRDLDDCNVARGASPQICEIEVWEKLWENFREFTVKCEVDEPEFSVETKVRDKRQNIKRDQDGNPSNYRRLRREILYGGQTQADRNNEDIKLLARQGVTHLNAQSNKNNKYKPIEVVSATTQVVAGIMYRIKTKVSESDCSKNDPRDLDDCNVARGASPQICEIEVWEKLWENFRKFTVKCEVDEPEFSVETKVRDKRQNIKRDQDGNPSNYRRLRREILYGGQTQADRNNEDIKLLARQGVTHLNAQSNKNNKYKPIEVVSATTQVVAGIMYRIKTKVSESDCSKNDPRDLDDCNVARGASPQICEIEVWEKLWENFRKFTVKCEVDEPEFSVETKVRDKRQNIKRDQDGNPSNYRRLRREILAGGQTQADRNNEKIKLLARQGVTHLNAQSNKNNKYKPIEIVSATTQVVAGQLYRIKTKVSESDCSKNDPRDLDDCNVAQGATPQICEIKVWEKLWQNFRRFTIKCEVDEPEFSIETKVRDKRQTRGGQNQVSEGDELVVKYLEDGLSRLDGQSSHENKYKVHEVISATSQVVAGHIYRIKTKIVLSDCKKTVSTKRGQCGTLTGAQPKICDFEVFEQPWIANSRVTNVTCDNEAHSFRAKRETNHAGTGFLGNDDRRVQFELFSDFIKTYKKTYSDKKEYKYRFKVFAENLYQMRVLNTYEQGTAVYGVTKFADMTQKEFSKSLGLRTDLRNENEPPFAQAKIPDVELPTEFDWRKNGAVTPVKNQEQCGSCWAFSVTGNVEGQYAIKHDKLLEFSEQELVDCDTEDQGCNGGLMDTAYRQIEKLGGLETEQDYPYDAEDEKCHFNRSLARVQLTGALNISHNEDDMAKWLVANGPISIAINANAMQFYMGGVSHPFKFLCNPKNLDHGVLIVGYGVHTYSLFNKTLPYWIVKNSWGTSWGEQGYYRVYKGDGTCGLNQTPSSAIVA